MEASGVRWRCLCFINKGRSLGSAGPLKPDWWEMNSRNTSVSGMSSLVWGCWQDGKSFIPVSVVRCESVSHASRMVVFFSLSRMRCCVERMCDCVCVLVDVWVLTKIIIIIVIVIIIIIIIIITQKREVQHTAKKPVSHQEPNPGPCYYTPQDQLTDQR